MDTPFVLGGAAILLLLLCKLKKGKRARMPRDKLDEAVTVWPDGTPFTVRHLHQSICCFGATGSGKSSGTGLYFGNALFALKNSAGLILCSKPEDLGFFKNLARKSGRLDDLLIFGPGENLRLNFLDFVGGDSLELTNFLMLSAETLRNADSGVAARMRSSGRNPPSGRSITRSPS